MTAAEMDARILDLIAQDSSAGGSNFTAARRLRALNEQYEICCTQKELGLVEQKIAVGTSYGVNGSVWEYDYPTPSTDANIANPRQALASVSGFVAIKQILNRQSVVLGQPVLLEKKSYEWISDRRFRYPFVTYPYQFVFWANRKPRRGYVLYPVPVSQFSATDSPLLATFVARPTALTGSEDETSILLPPQYHPMLCKYATAALLKSIGDPAWEEENRGAEVMLSEFVGHDNENISGVVSHGASRFWWRYNTKGN